MASSKRSIVVIVASLLALHLGIQLSYGQDYEFVTKWGSYGSGDGQFDYPMGIAVDGSGYVYVTDVYNHRVQKFTSSGAYVTQWGSQGSGNGQFNNPFGIAVDSSGYVYVTELLNYRVQKFTSSGAYVTQWGNQGSGNGQFIYPTGIAVDSSGYVYVTDMLNYRVQKFTSNGVYVARWGSLGTGDGQFDHPYKIAVDSSGYVYVTDNGNDRVQKFTSNGVYVTQWGSLGTGDGQFDFPIGIAVDSSGYVYVTDSGNDRVQKFTSSGGLVTKWGSSGSNDGQFNLPTGTAIDSFGHVYVSEAGNFRVQVFQLAPAITVTSPNGGEIWDAGSFHDITWTTSGVANVKIEYSTDEGSTWDLLIDSTANDGIYNWPIPNKASFHCIVRISEVADGGLVDLSDGFFAIIPTDGFLVVSPMAHEQWIVGSQQPVMWDTFGNYSMVRIELSTNNGSTWVTLAETANTGSWLWTVPDTISSQCLIKVSDLTDGVPSDTSDTVFSIEALSITVTAPNGGESWPVGSSQEITWTTSIGIEYVKIELSTDNGSTWVTISSGTENDESYSWPVADMISSQCLVKISDSADGVPSDTSEAVFSIIPPGPVTGSIQVTSTPTGAAVFLDAVNTGHTTNCTQVGVAPGNHNVRLVKDGYADYSGNVNVVVGQTVSVDVLLTKNTITVTQPALGATWIKGTAVDIRWTVGSPSIGQSTTPGQSKAADIAKVKIDLYKGTVLVQVVAAESDNDGSYAWTVPAILADGSDYRIRVSCSTDPSVYGESVLFIITSAAIQKDDFVGTWDGQGVYFRNSDTGAWVKLASPATKITVGDLDGDEIDDLIGLWPGQGGIWVKYSQSGTWIRLSSTAQNIAAGDMNGDGRVDLVGTWDGQGVYYRNSISGAWVKMASPATMVSAGDFDGDGTDDLIGLWPSQGGIWVKYSQSGAWARLSSTAVHIAAGDMNGDGRDDLLGTWDGQGVFYRDSITGAWVKMASPATLITTGDIDGDEMDDLIGIWPTQGGVWVKYSSDGTWERLSSTAQDIAAGKMRAAGGGAAESLEVVAQQTVEELPLPMGGSEDGPGVALNKKDVSDKGPGGARFVYIEDINLEPREGSQAESLRVPGPGERGFSSAEQENLFPQEHEKRNRDAEKSHQLKKKATKR